MLKILLFIALLLHPISLYAFQNEQDGYNGITWGTDISTLQGMRYQASKSKGKDVKVYTREQDILMFEHVGLSSIEYEFIRGKLTAITMKVKGLSTFVAFRDAVFNKFGRGREFMKNTERYYWDGNFTRITLISNFDLS